MMELTKERLQEIAEDGFMKHGEAKAMARQLLASMEQEPVAEPKSESKDGTVTVYPWLVSISFFEKDMRMWTPYTLVTHRYDDGLITKEDLHEGLREWIKGEIGDNLYTITFFGRMAPYPAPQQETK